MLLLQPIFQFVFYVYLAVRNIIKYIESLIFLGDECLFNARLISQELHFTDQRFNMNRRNSRRVLANNYRCSGEICAKATVSEVMFNIFP